MEREIARLNWLALPDPPFLDLRMMASNRRRQQLPSYSLDAFVECPDGGIKRVNFVADGVGEGGDLLAEYDFGQGRLDKV
jgi:hypothetical protein